jgi:hypothetical protein
MLGNNRSYYNKGMPYHRIKNNPLSSFENKQSFSNISYMVLFTYVAIYGVIITALYQVTL